nr:MAG TPA: hypothetical protein [Caudoviricetes sp.]DAN44539.1 MAG TPA: hypothetical protein [Bacteriophage sp.]DAW66446.1 MAG TPA: hypothetical protein [Bacteriophage sp.]
MCFSHSNVISLTHSTLSYLHYTYYLLIFYVPLS